MKQILFYHFNVLNYAKAKYDDNQTNKQSFWVKNLNVCNQQKAKGKKAATQGYNCGC